MSVCEMPDWNGRTIRAVQSRGGVWAFLDYSDGVIRPSGCAWPPPEIVQKLSRSDKQMYFHEEDRPFLDERLGYYTDLQSVHSEDAIVWSYFGPLAYASRDGRCRWAQWLLERLGCPSQVTDCVVSLWRRVPHPDNYSQGGPELDVIVQTDQAAVLMEAKWRSGEARWQGIDGRTGQIELRCRFIRLVGARIYGERKLTLLSITLDEQPAHVAQADAPPVMSLLWKHIVDCQVHPISHEIRRYYDWKRNLISRRRGIPAPG